MFHLLLTFVSLFQLFRSILNYLTNACKHTQSGSIQLRLYARKASNANSVDLCGLSGSLVAPMTDVLVVECEDTGPGIPLEKLPTLFTPLADVQSSDVNHQSNSGLGLYSVANGKCRSVQGLEY